MQISSDTLGIILKGKANTKCALQESTNGEYLL